MSHCNLLFEHATIYMLGGSTTESSVGYLSNAGVSPPHLFSWEIQPNIINLNMKNILISTSLFAALASSVTAQTTIGFDSAGEFTSNFLANGAAPTMANTLTNTDGLNGTARVTNNASAYNVFQTAIDPTAGAFEVGVYFFYDGSGATNDHRIAVGLTANNNDERVSSTGGTRLLGNAGTAEHIHVTWNEDSHLAGTSQISIQARSQNSFVGGFGATTAAMTSGWHYMSVSSSSASGGNFNDFVIGLYTSDNTGTITGTVQESAATTLATGLASDSEIYGYFGGSFGSSTLDFFDDFTVNAVPEPSSYAFISGFLALSWIMVRRRK